MSAASAPLQPHVEPRITANDLALYMVSSDTTRLSIIRRNKYPSRPTVIPYQDAKRWLTKFLADPARDRVILADAVSFFQQRAGDASVSDLKRNDAQLSVKAIESFHLAYNTLGLGRVDFVVPSRRLAPLTIEGVQVSTTLDLVSHLSVKNEDFAGGIIFCLTQPSDSDAGKAKREAQGYFAATLAYLQVADKKPTGRKPLARISFSIDVQHQQAFQARAGSRRISDLSSACRMIASIWPTI